MPINVGDLLRERDRLYQTIEEAKVAKARIKQLNILIAMYGDASNVEVRDLRAVKSELCLVPDCGRPQHIRGLCISHYSRSRDSKDPQVKAELQALMLPPKTFAGGRAKAKNRAAS